MLIRGLLLCWIFLIPLSPGASASPFQSNGVVSTGLRPPQQDDSTAEMEGINSRLPKRFAIDEDRVAAHQIRKLTGKHLLLYTDVRDRADIEELVEVFDLAVPQWCDYFSVDPQRTSAWQMRAFVIEDPARFKAAGLMPADLPDFLAGYQRGPEMWVYLQPGDYYTRHLLLHEGTHGFMEWFLDGLGAPWYAEGMAELLGLNQWDKSAAGQPSRLKIHHQVRDRSETPYWGRVKVVREDWDSHAGLSLQEMMNLPSGSFRKVQSYGWAWAGCEFLSHHELSQSAFAEFDDFANRPLPRFNREVQKRLTPNIDVLSRDWLLFINEMDYGIDVGKTCLLAARTIASGSKQHRCVIESNHGWQSTTIAVKRGERWRVKSDSRFQVGQSLVDGVAMGWPCSAGGITLEYYRSQPLGILLAGVLDADNENPATAVDNLLHPTTVGQNSVLEITTDGLLCLRINDSPARMADNEGTLEVSIEKLE